jgi:uncharacterized protein (DUF169 family)
MRTLDEYIQAGRDLYAKLHLASYPVAVTYIEDESEIPEGTFRPSLAGKKLALCQAFTLSRRWGFHVAMTADDNFCTPATAFHGWVDISQDDLVESQVRQGWHKDRQAETRRIETARAMLNAEPHEGAKRYRGLVAAPLGETRLVPHSVLVYGDGVQVTHMIHALCYESGTPLQSFFEGFEESCVKGGLLPFLLDRAQVVLPGMGDRSFADIGEGELAVGMPARHVFTVLENLFKTGGAMNFGYPARIMLPTDITEAITPGFQFLREKMDAKKR